MSVPLDGHSTMAAVTQSIAKRLWRQANKSSVSSTTPPLSLPPPQPLPPRPPPRPRAPPPPPERCLLLAHLPPVRLIFQSYLNSTAAARLMQTSRAISACLLVDYAFVDHVFSFPTGAAHVRALSFYASYRMHVLRMSLPRDCDIELDRRRWGSRATSWAWLGFEHLPLPSSLVALTTAPGSQLVRHVQSCDGWDTAWSVQRYCSASGKFNVPLEPGTLSHGLRFLQLNDGYTRRLQTRSIPDTVEVLQLDCDLDRPLEVGVLPVCLTHLVFSYQYDQPLLPGVLPASLRRLHLGSSYNQPLIEGVLPSQLQQLELGHYYNRPISPGVIPASVTHLRLSDCYDRRLHPGSIPHGVVHLSIGEQYDHPLLPGVLPCSLRHLAISRMVSHPLQPGSLPDGLEVVAFDYWSSSQHPLQPGVIPASVRAVRMGQRFRAELAAGAIPATVRWLRLPECYAERDLSGVVLGATHIEYGRRAHS